MKKQVHLRLALCTSGFALMGNCALATDATNITSATKTTGIIENAASALIVPNEHLSAQGIPPILAATAQRAEKYNDFRLRALVAWNPIQREMLISTRTTSTTNQLHLLRQPLGELTQITHYPDPVSSASYEPKKGAYIVFEKDEGGNEARQLYRMDMQGKSAGMVSLLTDPKEKHSAGPWNHHGEKMVLASTQLDKTAGAARRTIVTTDIWLLDPTKPDAKRKLASLPGGGWGGYQWSRDDRTLLAVNYTSINASSVWLLDIDSGKSRQILPAAASKGNPEIQYSSLAFTKDGKHLLATSDQDGEFLQLIRYDLKNLKATPLSKGIAWDISTIELADNGDQVAALVNRDGLSELHLFDAAKGHELKPPTVPSGAVTHIAWSKAKAAEIGFDLNSAHSPGEVYSLNVKTGQVEQWTRPDSTATGTIDTSGFKNADIIRWNSFDKLPISGLISRPPAGKFTGPRPVLIQIHGGPEAQAKIGFLGRNNYLTNELGIVVIQPNVRGSAGFGKTFLKRDNGMLREDSVKDIGALFDWIATQPDLDAKHVAVSGGSYGGYMSLAVATTYADRIVGAIDVVGISHFANFLERTESYRRDLRRVEYGDERIPAMRAFMDRIAPLNNAQKITKPLLVIQGKNDPRVPLYEAEQIVARVRENKTPVWYLVADNEGHGFRRKPNTDFYFFTVIRFLEEYLLK
jgi:dipeptidyl aminopeptidase/acylaminoacyl peptidase